MSIRLFQELGDRSGIFDKRYLIGTLFPTLLGLILMFIILTKNLPLELIEWTYLIFIAFIISIVLNEINPWLCWKTSFTASKYLNELKTNLDSMFIIHIEDYISNSDDKNNITEKDYREKFKDYLPTFCNSAKKDYIGNFFIPTGRHFHEKLALQETRFILILTSAIFVSLNALLTFYLYFRPIDFWIFQRDPIVTQYYVFITFMGTFLSISVLSVFYLLQRKSLWKLIIQSTNVPFEADSRDKRIHRSRMQSFYELSSPNYIDKQYGMFKDKPKDTDFIYNDQESRFNNLSDKILLDSLKQITFKYIKDEYRFNTRQNIIKQAYIEFFETYKDDLKLDNREIRKMSNKLAEESEHIDIYKLGIQAENAVLVHIKLKYAEKIDKILHGRKMGNRYMDFIIILQNGKNIGIGIKVIGSSSFLPNFLIHRLLTSFNKSLSEDKFDEIRLYIIYKSKSLINNIEKVKYRLYDSSLNKNIKFLFGYLSPDGIYNEVYSFSADDLKY